MKRRNSARSFSKNDKNPAVKQSFDVMKKFNLSNIESVSTSKVTFNENEEGEIKEIDIEVNLRIMKM